MLGLGNLELPIRIIIIRKHRLLPLGILGYGGPSEMYILYVATCCSGPID